MIVAQPKETYYQNPSAVPLGSPWTHTFKNMVGTNVRTALTDVLGVDNIYLGLRFPVRSLISHVLLWGIQNQSAHARTVAPLPLYGRELSAFMSELTLSRNGEQYLNLTDPAALNGDPEFSLFYREAETAMWGRCKLTYDTQNSAPLLLLICRGTGIHTWPQECDEQDRAWLYGISNVNPTEFSIHIKGGSMQLTNLYADSYQAAIFFKQVRRVTTNSQGFARVENVVN